MQTAASRSLPLALALWTTALVGLTGAAHAADVTVVNLSEDESIQAAVDAAAPGDTILIVGQDGDYLYEQLVIDGKGSDELQLAKANILGFVSGSKSFLA